MEMKMEKKVISIGLAAILVIAVFAAVTGIASAHTYYNETGNYIEGINVTVDTTIKFNVSDCCTPLEFLINNTLNESATSFNVTTQPGLTTNATGDMANDSWFWVNASIAGTYWVNVSNNENRSEYVNFTVEYSSITITTYNENGKYIEGINVSVNTSDNVYFNRSNINVPLTFQINNTLNPTAANFSVANQSGLTTNATGKTLYANDSFWVNATEAGTYCIKVFNKDNQSEYVYFTVEYSPPSPPEGITITIKPETLNLRSKGVFTAFITNVTAINVSTVECEGAPAVRGMASEEDDGTYIVKFNRQDLVNVKEGDNVTLNVTGKLNDGTPFEGNDTIRVIDRERWGLGFLGNPLNEVKKWAKGVHKKFSTSGDDAIARIQVDKGAQPKVPVIIGFKDKPSQADKNKIRGHSGDIKHSYTIINAIAAKLPEQAIDKIKKNPRVAYVEMDGEVHALDIELNNSWGVKRIGAGTVHADNKGTGVKVAIIDTGIDYTHSDLDANYRGGYDYVNNDKVPMDDNGHGTHCAGIVAAEDNGEGVVGVAPEAHLYAVKVLDSSGSGFLSDVIAGIQWSRNNGMQVISMSLGADTDSPSLHDACDAADAAGIVVVAAAGNDGTPPGKGDNVDYPGAYSSVIAVAATGSNDERPRWSSTGPAVELAAPGVSINSTYPGGYATISGTSMACPHVSGTAALVIASDSSLSNDEVRLRLRETADDLGATGKDNQYGYGLVDADEAASPTGNQPPVADAGADQTVRDAEGNGVEVTLDGSGSYDPDGSIGPYVWKEGEISLGTGASITWNFSIGMHTVTLTVTDDGGASSSDDVIVTVTEAPTNTMHVASIVMSTTTKSRGMTYATATVTIVDATNASVKGATVYGTWSGLTSDSAFGRTGRDGRVALKSDSVKNAEGTFNFTVDTAEHSVLVYNPEANNETSNSITV